MLAVFEKITDDIANKGYSVIENALPADLYLALKREFDTRIENTFEKAGIGRGSDHQLTSQIRSDNISWIDESSEAGASWLLWAQDLQTCLNKNLFMGLFSFESHFASYEKGAFYKKHLDAFKGQTNRVNRKLSLVTYLNQYWANEDGGELVIYDSDENEIHRVIPNAGTVVVFLSEEFPHEVLPALKPRASIAGWFRVNASVGGVIDPPS